MFLLGEGRGALCGVGEADFTSGQAKQHPLVGRSGDELM